MLLAGDLGGTKTLLGLFRRGPHRPAPLHVTEFTTLQYGGIGEIIRQFLDAHPEHGEPIEAACVGVAGPVVDQIARLTNVPWRVEAAEIARELPIPRVALINDLAAMAHAVPVLEPAELVVLQAGRTDPRGNAALIAAGTGLGQALLHRIGNRFVPSPSEGGHADFAARTPREAALVEHLTRLYGRAECEHVICGPGLVNIHQFLHPEGCEACGPDLDPAEAPAVISRAGLEGRCERCVETLQLFVSTFGAEAGNLGLRSVATGGVYIGGGIAPKILPALQSGAFMKAFRAKAPMAELMAAMPVAVILNQQAGLLGAAVHASNAGSWS